MEEVAEKVDISNDFEASLVVSFLFFKVLRFVLLYYSVTVSKWDYVDDT